jgi:hypothetical protein
LYYILLNQLISNEFLLLLLFLLYLPNQIED